MPGLEPGGCKTPDGSGLQYHLLHATDALPFSHTADQRSRWPRSPQRSPSAATMNQDACVCPCRQARAARQEARQGSVLLLDGQSFAHFYPFQPRNRLWRWQLNAMLPEAVLTLPRKRELMLMNARRAEEGDPSPSPGLAGGTVPC